MWNNLPSDIKSSSSISILKANLYKYCNNKLNAVFDTDRSRIRNHCVTNVGHCKQIVAPELISAMFEEQICIIRVSSIIQLQNI